jgi:hypothetical protein
MPYFLLRIKYGWGAEEKFVLKQIPQPQFAIGRRNDVSIRNKAYYISSRFISNQKPTVIFAIIFQRLLQYPYWKFLI